MVWQIVIFCRILKASLANDLSSGLNFYDKPEETQSTPILNTSCNSNEEVPSNRDSEKLLDPFCHYNTSLNSKWTVMVKNTNMFKILQIFLG